MIDADVLDFLAENARNLSHPVLSDQWIDCRQIWKRGDAEEVSWRAGSRATGSIMLATPLQFNGWRAQVVVRFVVNGS